MNQLRGQLTDRIKKRSKTLLGYEITQKELRLMAYVQCVMMNEQRIDPNKIGGGERMILTEWRKAGHIEGGASQMGITKHFWESICEIIFLGYVDID